uniref:Uncharacterized protein n=1 Tax=Solanum lycopersicum TaxID=4081 RepID=A0A3Q7G1G4_SOLLC
MLFVTFFLDFMQDSLCQSLPNERTEELKMFKITLERIMIFLQLNKHDINLCHKEKLRVTSSGSHPYKSDGSHDDLCQVWNGFEIFGIDRLSSGSKLDDH